MNRYARRLQKIGSSILVSLPSDWVKKNDLKKGATVLIEVNTDNSISLFPSATQIEETKQVTIPYSPFSMESLINQIYGAYLLGYDTIRIKAKSHISFDHREAMKHAMRKLVGLEIVDEDISNITSQFLIDAISLDAEKILKRMNSIIAGMHRDTLEVLLTKDTAVGKLVMTRDDEVDRQYFLLVRLIRSAMMDQKLARKLNLSNIDILDYRIAANHLESVGDYIVDFASSLPDLYESKFVDAFSEAGVLIESMQSKSIAAFVNKNSSESIEVVKIYNKFNELMNFLKQFAIREGSRSSSDISTFNSIHLMNNIAKAFVDIADLVKPGYLIPPLKIFGEYSMF
jgi:phosphate uptake regulator